MITTPTFTFNSPYQQFKESLIRFNVDEKTYDFEQKWIDFSDDIFAWLDGIVENPDFDWNVEIAACKAILGAYINHCLMYPEAAIDFETYWKELMDSAISDNYESFFTEEE